MCRVLAERKLAVCGGGAGAGGGELLLFEKRVSGLHNSASTEMKQRQRKGERKRQREREKNSCAALTDDLTGETEFVFCWEMSDALPGREKDREKKRDGGRKSTPQNLSCVFFALSFLLRFKTAR